MSFNNWKIIDISIWIVFQNKSCGCRTDLLHILTISVEKSEI